MVIPYTWGMRISRIAVFLALAVVLGVPFLVRPSGSKDVPPAGSPVLVVVTPHIQQIRYEFARAFDRWHERVYGTRVLVDYRTPGGTSEIRKQLDAQYQAEAERIINQLKRSDPDLLASGDFRLGDHYETGSMGFDLMFGGGSYDHGRLKRGVKVTFTVRGPDGPEKRSQQVPVSAPAGFTQEQMDAWFGDNRIGTQELYDPDQYWIGTALSSFGIVYNRDTLAQLGIDEPDSFADLTDPRLRGWVALADPRQSGSITTTFDSILGNLGWDEGWRLLRAMSANTRYFTNSSTKPPIDVSQGEAAMGLAIDFYGRGQAQMVMRPGETAETCRVGYTDPAKVYVDADPVSILRGAPHPELARHFVEFCMTEEAQALWQFHRPDSDAGRDNPVGASGKAMGPRLYELRRMPVRRVMYEKYMPYFVDKVNPFGLASDIGNPGWRSGVQMMMGCFAIDIADEQRSAWAALCEAGADPAFPAETLARMRELFYAFPEHQMPLKEDGSAGDVLMFNEANYKAIKDSWKVRGWKERSRLAYTAFFRENYRRIRKMSKEAKE